MKRARRKPGIIGANDGDDAWHEPRAATVLSRLPTAGACRVDGVLV